MPNRQTKVSGWHAEEIKARIRMTGVSMAQLSIVHGYSAGFLGAALHRRLFEAEQIIAKQISISAQELWPDRYSRDGKPLHQGRQPNRNKLRQHLRLVTK